MPDDPEPMSLAMVRRIQAHLRYYYKQADEYLDSLSDEVWCMWYVDLIQIRQEELSQTLPKI